MSDNNQENIKEKDVKKKGKSKFFKIAKYIIIIFAICVIFFSGILFNTIFNGQTKTTKLGFEDVGELVTQTGYLTIVQDSKEHREFFSLFQIPFTESRQIFSYDLEVDASVNFSEITKNIDDKKEEIKIEMPHAKIYKATIKNDSLKVYLDEERLFSRIDLNEQNEAIEEMKKQGIQDAEANGILELAEANAERLITNFVKSNGSYKDYNIIFEYKGE